MSVASPRRPVTLPSGALALAAFSAAAVGAGLGRGLVTTYLPVLLERIRDAPGLIGTVMLVNTAAGFAVPLVVGAWSDRLRARGHGRTLPFVLGGSLLAAGGLVGIALGHASSYAALALLAAITYVGLNAVTTGHRALIPQTFDDGRRAAATGGEEVAMLGGTLAGVVVGGALIGAHGWAPFAAGAVVLPLLALPTVLRMRGVEAPVAPPEGGRPGLRLYLRAAVRPGARLVLAAQTLWVAGYVGLAPFFVLYADHVLGLGAGPASLLLAGFGVVGGATMLAAGTAPPDRRPWLLVLGALAMGGGLLAVAMAPGVAVVAAGLLPAAVGFGVLTTLGFPVYARHVPVGEEGTYSALYFAARAVAAAVAVPAAGWTIALTGSYRALFAFGAVLTLAALVPLARLAAGDAVRRAWDRLAPLAAFAALAGAVLAAGRLVQGTALKQVDIAGFDLLYDLGSTPELVDRLLVDPHLPNYTVITLLTVWAAHRARRGDGLRAGLLVVASGLLAYAAVRGIWAAWDRPRPQEDLGVPPPNGHDWSGYGSFPSGHVAVTTALVVAAAHRVTWLRWPLYAYAGVIALTRLSYGAHFPADVVAALAIGVLAAWTSLALAGERPLRLPAWPSDLPAWSRRAARVTSLLALGGFAALVLVRGPPAGPDGGVLRSAVEHDVQVGLLVAAAAAVAAAWWRAGFGALLALIGAALGVLAAVEYLPGLAVLACLALLVPGVLFLLGDPRMHRARALAALAVALLGLLAGGAVAAVRVHDAVFGPAHPQSRLAAPPTWRVDWAWSGGVTPRGFTVAARLVDEGSVRLVVGTDRGLRGGRRTALARADDRDRRIVRFAVAGLRPDTDYFWALEVEGRVDRNRVGHVRTFPEGAASFRFAFGACARVGSNGAVFDAIRRTRPLFFLSAGDFFYANIEQNARRRYLDQFDRALSTPAQGALFRSAPVAYVWDDHDFGGDGSDARAVSRPAARGAYRLAVPHYPLPAGRAGAIYQAFTVGRVRFLLLDTRSERRPDRGTMLGAAQRAWLERELLAGRGRHPVTVVVSSVPWIAGAQKGADNWGGYARERAAISRFVARHRIRGLVMLSGDAHMLAIDDGTHSDYSGTGRARFPVMHSGALDRRGSVKGGPYSEGAFPGAGQFATVDVRDRGDRVEVVLTGRRYDGRRIVRHAFAVPAPRAPAPAGRRAARR